MNDRRVTWTERAARAVLAIVVAVTAFVVVPAPVSAQLFENPPLLLRLFGVKNKEEQSRGGARIIRVPESGPSNAPALGPNGPVVPRIIKAPEPELQIKPKNEDAKTVLVLGDDWATSLASGLNVAFADTPGVKIEAAAVEGSGLADRSKVDWVVRLSDRLTGDDPADAVVVLLGPSDRMPMSVDGEDAEFRSQPWETVYRARVQALITAARSRNIPLFWLGLVPTADFDQTTDFAYLDELYRQESNENLAVYIDVWNAFADETGSFAASGPDVEGQVRKLRLRDGVGFTKSGSRKMAFFVEQEIRKWVDRGAPGIVLPKTSGAGLVVSLGDPDEDADELAPNAPPPLPKEGTALHSLVVEGSPITPVTGRVDDLTIVR